VTVKSGICARAKTKGEIFIVSDQYRFIDCGKGDPAYNMAFDEALLNSSEEFGTPVLRLYDWTSDSATFGYFQKYDDVELSTSCRPLIRRPTGGGIVAHTSDLTYSLVFPRSHSWTLRSARESYAEVHRWISGCVESYGLKSYLSEEPIVAGVGRCFVGAEKDDVMVGDQKIAGAAQRRNRKGLLIQGSVQLGALGPNELQEWPRRVREIGARHWSCDFVDWEPSGLFLAKVSELTRTKYSRATYNQKR
jgi:lipoate-protein ligase A